jgi:hypothetical protein
MFGEDNCLIRVPMAMPYSCMYGHEMGSDQKAVSPVFGGIICLFPKQLSELVNKLAYRQAKLMGHEY